MVALVEFPALLEAYTAGTGAHTRHGHKTYGDHIPSNIRGPECQQNGRPFENYQYRPTDCCEMQPIHLITNSAMRNRRLQWQTHIHSLALLFVVTLGHRPIHLMYLQIQHLSMFKSKLRTLVRIYQAMIGKSKGTVADIILEQILVFNT